MWKLVEREIFLTQILFLFSARFSLSLRLLEPSPLYDNHHYHEECLRCNSCAINLTGVNQKRARRFKNQILCDLHFAGNLKILGFVKIFFKKTFFFSDVALMECSDFMQQLRSFKPQSLGSIVARRKSSTTLIFPLPPQACSGKKQNFNFFLSRGKILGKFCFAFFLLQQGEFMATFRVQSFSQHYKPVGTKRTFALASFEREEK